jgi:glycosyltransferase involved in cell wall biosynthesis
MHGQTTPPVFSVIVPAYNAGQEHDQAFGALTSQRFEHPFEVIVVDSGPLSVSQLVRQRYPEFRIVRSEHRLGPGQARNAGVNIARGRYIAFCSVDTPPVPHWLSERYAEHVKGFPLVAGSISNGTPRHPVGTAGYLLEYSALVPCIASSAAPSHSPRSVL